MSNIAEEQESCTIVKVIDYLSVLKQLRGLDKNILNKKKQNVKIKQSYLLFLSPQLGHEDKSGRKIHRGNLHVMMVSIVLDV